MIKSLLQFIKAILAVFVLLLNFIPIPGLITLFMLSTLIIPLKSWRRTAELFCHNILAPLWVDINRAILRFSAPKTEIVFSGGGQLSMQGWYCMISNHQSWIDILLLQQIFNRKIPILKFFMKQSLLWKLPVVGLACWLLGFPFMKRYSASYLKKHPDKKGIDLEATRKSCERFKNDPIAVVNYIEGTRFSLEKKRRQNSPYQHLLYPKAGGLAVTLYALQDCLQQIIDITIVYPNGSSSFWDFMCGKMKKIIIHYELLAIPATLQQDYSQSAAVRKEFHAWLNQLWQAKDQRITELIS